MSIGGLKLEVEHRSETSNAHVLFARHAKVCGFRGRVTLLSSLRAGAERIRDMLEGALDRRGRPPNRIGVYGNCFLFAG